MIQNTPMAPQMAANNHPADSRTDRRRPKGLSPTTCVKPDPINRRYTHLITAITGTLLGCVFIFMNFERFEICSLTINKVNFVKTDISNPNRCHLSGPSMSVLNKFIQDMEILNVTSFGNSREFIVKQIAMLYDVLMMKILSLACSSYGTLRQSTILVMGHVYLVVDILWCNHHQGSKSNAKHQNISTIDPSLLLKNIYDIYIYMYIYITRIVEDQSKHAT